MNFERVCKTQVVPLDPKKVLAEYLKYNSDILYDIFKDRENIYKEILDIILKERENDLSVFVGWYWDYLYNY